MICAPEVRLCADLWTYCAHAASLLCSSSPADAVAVLDGGRSTKALEDHFPNGRMTRVDPAEPGDRPSAEEMAGRLSDRGAGEGDPDRILLALAGHTESLPAIYYGRATGRRVELAADFGAFESVLRGARSAILGGPPAAFDKDFLRRLLQWAGEAPDAPRQIGIFTGRDVVQACDLAAKSLLASGPTDKGSPLAAFEMIGAHGNEIHLDHRDRVLCGRSPGAAGETGSGFDCGNACPHADRQDARLIRACTVFLISCDGFTPAGGLAPNGFSLLFRLLDGPASAVVAPYKHVQANEPLIVMIEAMAGSGYALGDIATVANSRGNRGMPADPAFLVLGDPERRASALCAETQPEEIVETALGPLVRTVGGPGRSAISLTLSVPPGDEPLAVLPVSEGLRTAEAFFALGPRGAASMDVTLFAEAALPDAELEFALVSARPPDRDAIANARRRLDGCRLFEAVLDPREVAGLQTPLWELLRAALAFPRPIESLLGQNRMLHLDHLIEGRFELLQAGLRDALLEALAERRLWISQDYRDLFQRVWRAGPDDDGQCPHCANHVTAWRYEDELTGLAARIVLICSRCGIVSDAPLASPMEIGFDTIGSFRSRNEPITVRLSNRADASIRVSLAVQLNAWRDARVACTGCRAELEIAPGATVDHRAILHLPDSFPDDILSVQLFLVDESLGLSFASQKVMAQVR